MTRASSGGRAKRGIVASIVLIGFAMGIAAAAWFQVDEKEGGTYAAIFGPEIVDLRLDGDGRVNGFVGSPNLAPGDGAAGRLRLYTDKEASDTTDLDFDVKVSGGAASGPRLDRVLFVTQLSYGADDLLSSADGGRNFTTAMDSGAAGDRDGRVSVAELVAGANDLPAPRTQAQGGTVYAIQIAFHPDRSESGDNYRGQQIDVQFVFRLADSLDSDLN